MELLKLTSTWASTRRTTPSSMSWSTLAFTFSTPESATTVGVRCQILPSFPQDFARRDGIESSRKAPRQDPAREVVDDRMKVALRVIEKPDDRHVDVPVLVGVRGPNPGFRLFGIHTATRSPPTTLPDELGPGCRRRKDLAGSLRIEGQSSKRHVPILGSGHHLLDGAHLGRGELRWMRPWAARSIIERASFLSSLPSVVAGRGQAHQA